VAIENRIIGESDVAPEDLTGNPHNWRTHSQAQRDVIAGGLEEVGWVQRVIVNQRTGHLVDGHARVAVAEQRGEPTIPVLYIDVSEEEEHLLLASLDPIAAMAGEDHEALARLLAGVSSEDSALAALLDGLGDEAAAAMREVDHPEAEITPLMMERADYVVLVFDNELDWIAAVDTLGLKRVKAPNSRGRSPKYGLGRVLPGAPIVQRLNAAQ